MTFRRTLKKKVNRKYYHFMLICFFPSLFFNFEMFQLNVDYLQYTRSIGRIRRRDMEPCNFAPPIKTWGWIGRRLWFRLHLRYPPSFQLPPRWLRCFPITGKATVFQRERHLQSIQTPTKAHLRHHHRDSQPKHTTAAVDSHFALEHRKALAATDLVGVSEDSRTGHRGGGFVRRNMRRFAQGFGRGRCQRVGGLPRGDVRDSVGHRTADFQGFSRRNDQRSRCLCRA